MAKRLKKPIIRSIYCIFRRILECSVAKSESEKLIGTRHVSNYVKRFKIFMEKPFIKVSEREEGFIVSLNLRTAVELLSEMPDLNFTKAIEPYIPDFVKPRG